MKSMSIDRLIDLIKKRSNPTVVGLDPKLDYLPDFILKNSFASFGETLEGAANAIFEFNKGIIDAIYDIVPAVKPQSAYYEMYGWQGVKALYRTIQYAKEKGLFVIADVKRNDIGSTAEAYAAAYLGETSVGDKRIAAFNADAATINPYLGTDGISPFTKLEKMVFVLVKTSNPSSGELQDLMLDDIAVYQYMASLVEKWGGGKTGRYGFSNAGAVVGATYPKQLEMLRKDNPSTFFLVPGYGAQGAGAGDIACAFNANGLGAIINASRSIICAYKAHGGTQADFAAAARNEALKMKSDINKALNA